MARRRIFAVFVLAITAGGALALGTYNYVQQVPAAAAGIPTTPVVVAAKDLQIGAALRAEDLRVVEWPANAAPKDAFTTTDELVGRGVIMPLIENEPIMAMKLASKDAGAGLPPVIPAGFRALSVRVDEVIGVAGYVLPGTRVDVLATLSPTRDQVDVTSKVVLTDVQVLAAGTKIEQSEDGGKPMPVSVVTLLVNPLEAERLTLASTEGKIQLALRNPLDREAPSTTGIKPAALLSSGLPVRQPTRTASAATPRPVTAAPAAPAPAAGPDLPSVEIIRGDKRAREVLRQEPQ
jgi:pilus assembly protein CpaB